MKTKTFWIKRFHRWDSYYVYANKRATKSRWNRWNRWNRNFKLCYYDFEKITGKKLKHGECKEFKLVEVRRKS